MKDNLTVLTAVRLCILTVLVTLIISTVVFYISLHKRYIPFIVESRLKDIGVMQYSAVKRGFVPADSITILTVRDIDYLKTGN